MAKLTAWTGPQNLREHALAFWGYYNPHGRPLEEVDIELNENSINGILFSTLLAPTLDLATFQRRVARMVHLSQGAIRRTPAERLLCRTIGFEGGRYEMMVALRQGPIVNQAYVQNRGSLSSIADRNKEQVQRELEIRREVTAAEATDESVVAGYVNRDVLWRTDLVRAFRRLLVRRRTIRRDAIRQGLAVEVGANSSTRQRNARNFVARQIGYSDWEEMFYVYVALKEIPNLVRAPRSDLAQCIEQGRLMAETCGRPYKISELTVPEDPAEHHISGES